MKSVLKFFRQDEGAALAEYGLLVALIAVACIVAIGLLSTAIQGTFSAAAAQM